MEFLKSFIEEPHHYAVFFYKKSTMDFIGSYSICENYLYNVHVVEERKGYGTEMVKHALAEKKELYLDVDPENYAAVRCYEKCGFRYVKKLFNYHHPCWGNGVPVAKEIHRYAVGNVGEL